MTARGIGERGEQQWGDPSPQQLLGGQAGRTASPSPGGKRQRYQRRRRNSSPLVCSNGEVNKIITLWGRVHTLTNTVNRMENVALLLSFGADINIRGKNGLPLDVAAPVPKLKEMLQPQ